MLCGVIIRVSLILLAQASTKRSKDELVAAVLHKRQEEERIKQLHARQRAEAFRHKQELRYFESQVSPPKEHRPLVGKASQAASPKAAGKEVRIHTPVLLLFHNTHVEQSGFDNLHRRTIQAKKSASVS